MKNYLYKNTKPEGLKIDSPQLENYDLIISWDTEGKSLDYLEDPVLKKKNSLLSYQYSAYHKASDCYVEGVLYQNTPDLQNEQRLTLNNFLSQIVSHMGIKRSLLRKRIVSVSKKNPEKVVYKHSKVLLVAHFSGAEWSMLKKRDLLKPYLSEVHKGLLSFQEFPIKIEFPGKNFEEVMMSGRDTSLVSVNDKSRSLAGLTESTVNKKVKIDLEDSKYGISHMNEFMEKHPAQYLEYAINDARVALEYYCNGLNDYYLLSGVKEEPFTLGDASTKGNLKWLRDKSVKDGYEPSYYEQLILGVEKSDGSRRQKVKHRGLDESFANNCYFGGLNTAYQIGRFKSEDCIILDLDIKGAYGAALAMIPAVHGEKPSKKYFNGKKQSELENRLEKKSVQVGMFLVNDFKFPRALYQRSIPLPTEGGLVYVNQGKNAFCMYPEFIESLRQGNTIVEENLELRIYEELIEGDHVLMAFQDFIKYLNLERKKYPKGSMKNQIFKLMINSFYGKLGQGIRDRYVYNLAAEKKQIAPSAITVPHYAATCTSIIRTVLITVINHLQSIKGVQVLNATTDGLMVAFPKDLIPNGTQLVSKIDQGGKIDCTDLKLIDFIPFIMRDINNLYSIDVIRQGSLKIGNNIDEGLEIKHVGDEAYTGKTRINAINYLGKLQHIAHSGIYGSGGKFKSVIKLQELDAEDEIKTIENTTLTSIRDMLKYDCDLTQKKGLNHALSLQSNRKYQESIKVNLDYDYKREIFSDGSTRDFENLEAGREHRQISKRIRSSNKRASYELVEIAKGNPNQEKVRIAGTQLKTVARIVLQALIQYNGKPEYLSYVEISRRLNEWKNKAYPNEKGEFNKDFIYNVKRQKLIQKILPNTKKIRTQINAMLTALGMEISEERMQILINNETETNN